MRTCRCGRAAIGRRGEWPTADGTGVVIYDQPTGVAITLADIAAHREEWCPDVVPLPDALAAIAAIGVAQGTTRR